MKAVYQNRYKLERSRIKRSKRIKTDTVFALYSVSYAWFADHIFCDTCVVKQFKNSFYSHKGLNNKKL